MTETTINNYYIETQLRPVKANEAYFRQREDLQLLTKNGVVHLLAGALRTIGGDYNSKRIQVINPSLDKEILIGLNFLWNFSPRNGGYQADTGVIRLIRQNYQLGLYFPRFLQVVSLDDEYETKRHIFYSLKERPIKIQIDKPLANLTFIQKLQCIRQGTIIENIHDRDDFAGKIHLERWPIKI